MSWLCLATILASSLWFIHVNSLQRVCESEEIRLVGGSSYLEGRVEVCFRGNWGTVCDDEWDQNDANVACRQLGYSDRGAKALVKSEFGGGSGPIFLDDLQCNGTERSLFECVTLTDCDHGEDAGLVCQNNDVVLVHEGELIPNNSVISLESLGDSNARLFCVTTQPFCCDTNRSGNWFPPSEGSEPLDSSPNTLHLYQSWGDNQSIQLNRPSGVNSTERGLYRCEVPDRDNITQILYVGIYSSADEDFIRISGIRYERSSETLVCTSTGGPATSVTWTKDNTPLVLDGTTYQHSQTITDTTTATYENRLTIVSKSSSLSGVYTCSVWNQRGNSTESIEVTVCRNDEVKVIKESETIPPAVLVCRDNEWLIGSNTFVLSANGPAPRNFKITVHQNNLLLSWEPPLSTNENIEKYQVMCSTATESANGYAISTTLNRDAITAMIPVIPATEHVDYSCCVTAYIERDVGLMYSTKSCGMASTQFINSSLMLQSHEPTSLPILWIFIGILSIVVIVLFLIVVILLRKLFVNRREQNEIVNVPNAAYGYSSTAQSEVTPFVPNPTYESIGAVCSEPTVTIPNDACSKPPTTIPNDTIESIKHY